MGINPYNSYKNFSQNNISDPASELRRQLDARKAQLEKLNSMEVLSKDQQSRKNDLEKTVSLLQGKLDKRLNPTNTKPNIAADNKSQNSKPSMNFPEGRVISKNSYPSTYLSSNAANSSDTYLKGFFFDAKI